MAPARSNPKSHTESSLADSHDLPTEVVGDILSHVESAQSIALASGTCRRWREAAKHHLYKLSFTDIEANCRLGSSKDSWSEFGVIIIEAVLRTTRLRDLSIALPQGEIHAGVLIACLLHTRMTLECLSILNPITPKCNILEKLACREGVLEHLVWGSAYIPTVPKAGSLPCLASLNLMDVEGGLAFENLCLLFSVSPKLEFLSISNADIWKAPRSKVVLDISKLRTLHMERIRFYASELILLHADKLERFSMKFMSLRQLQMKGSASLQHLVIQDVVVQSFELGTLPSLREVNITDRNHNLSSYLHIISIASTELLSELTLLGDLPGGSAIVNVDKIASRFPCLRKLCIDYDNAFFVDKKPQSVFKDVSLLVVHVQLDTTKFKPFTECFIAGLLERCPSLKSLVIAPVLPSMGRSRTHCQAVSGLASFLTTILRLYPNVGLKFEVV